MYSFADAAVLPMKKESLDVSFDPGSSEKKSYVLIKSKIEGSNIGWVRIILNFYNKMCKKISNINNNQVHL